MDKKESQSKILDPEVLGSRIEHFVKNDKKKVKISFFSYVFTIRSLTILLISFFLGYKIYVNKTDILFINYSWASYIIVALAIYYVYRKYKFSGMTKKYKIYYKNRNNFILSKHLVILLRKHYFKKKGSNA